MRARIDPRFCGPPDSGNGGYSCGLLAQALGGSDVEVTLKLPPPLDRDLRIDAHGEEAELSDGDTLIATARRQIVALDVPLPPTLDEARAAEARYTGQRNHLFPTCFVCGPDRPAGDGLCIFPGSSGAGVAAVWTPDPSLVDADGKVKSEFVWAALDCPGFFAVEEAASPAVLGRFAVHIVDPTVRRQPLIVTGWPIASTGRKHRAGTALHTVDGRLLAFGDALWITLSAGRSGSA